MSIQTIEQKRAKQALVEVQTVIALTDDVIECEFVSYINELPAMIHMNGLGQTVAFYRSKKQPNKAENKKEDKDQNKYKNKDTHTILYMILSDWLCGNDKVYTEGGDLLVNITNNNMDSYRMAQTEAQAYLIWLKNFARAYLKDGSKGK